MIKLDHIPRILKAKSPIIIGQNWSKSATVSRQRNLFSNKERNHESWFSLWIFFRSVWIILELNNAMKYFLNEFLTRYSWNIYKSMIYILKNMEIKWRVNLVKMQSAYKWEFLLRNYSTQLWITTSANDLIYWRL